MQVGLPSRRGKRRSRDHDGAHDQQNAESDCHGLICLVRCGLVVASHKASHCERQAEVQNENVVSDAAADDPRSILSGTELSNKDWDECRENEKRNEETSQCDERLMPASKEQAGEALIARRFLEGFSLAVDDQIAPSFVNK